MIFIFEIIGTIAFAISGSMIALKHKLDLFGVVALGIITSTFGGVLRDLILGNTPPSAFTNSIYVICAAIVSLIVFLIAYFLQQSYKKFDSNEFKFILLLMDSIGLGIFTTVGTSIAWNMYIGNRFLAVLSGLITGVGGGLLRDIIVVELPDIFQKHIYAIASIIGAEICVILIVMNQLQIAIWLGTISIIIIRLLASYNHWSLPKVKIQD